MASIWHSVRDVLRGLPTVSPLGLLLAIRRPKSLPVFLADVWRSYRSNADLRAPAIMPHDLLKDRGALTMHLGEHGVFSSASGLLVVELVAVLQPMRVFEIGTLTGGLAARMAMNTPDEARIFTLDLPPGEQMPNGITDRHLVERGRAILGIHFRDTPWNGTKITQLLGNSKTFDFSPYYDSIDLVVIDASHSYEFVFNDSMHAFRMIRPGGVLLWHDYESQRSEYGVTSFVNRLWKNHTCPVYRFPGDTRYALMKVDGPTKKKLVTFAENPSSF